MCDICEAMYPKGGVCSLCGSQFAAFEAFTEHAYAVHSDSELQDVRFIGELPSWLSEGP